MICFAIFFGFSVFAACDDQFSATQRLNELLTKVKSETAKFGILKESIDNLLREIVYIQNGDVITARPPKATDTIYLSQKILSTHILINELVSELKNDHHPILLSYKTSLLEASLSLNATHSYLVQRAPYLSIEEQTRPLGRRSDHSLYDILADHTSQLQRLSQDLSSSIDALDLQ